MMEWSWKVFREKKRMEEVNFNWDVKLKAIVRMGFSNLVLAINSLSVMYYVYHKLVTI